MRLQRPVGASAEGGASADDVRNTPYIGCGDALSPVGPESLALPLGTGRARNSQLDQIKGGLVKAATVDDDDDYGDKMMMIRVAKY